MKQNFLSALLLIVGVVQAQIPNYVPQNGLQAFWPFTGNANDITANAYASTIFGATLTTDRFGNPNAAYAFNGVSDYIVSSYTGIQGNAARAVSFWAKKIDNSTCSAVSWGGNVQGTRYDCMFNYAGLGPTADCAYGAITYQSPSSPNDNLWHHYVYQYSGNNLSDVQIYMDAVLVTATVSTYNPTTPLNTNSDYNVTFGRVYFQPELFMYGSIDEIGIWNRTLTLCEIRTLYASSLSNVPQVVNSQSTVCTGQAVTYSVSGATSYTWSGGGNGPSKTYTALPSTTVSVTANNTTSGCTSTFTFSPKLVSCTGITEEEKTEVSVWPNPASYSVSFKGISSNCSLSIYDCMGRTVLLVTENFDKIDISNLAVGLYTVQISGKHNSQQKQFKLIIQH